MVNMKIMHHGHSTAPDKTLFSTKKALIFICVEILWPSQLNGAMLSMVSLPNHTFNEQARSSKWLTSIAHILLPEIENCPS